MIGMSVAVQLKDFDPNLYITIHWDPKQHGYLHADDTVLIRGQEYKYSELCNPLCYAPGEPWSGDDEHHLERTRRQRVQRMFNPNLSGFKKVTFEISFMPNCACVWVTTLMPIEWTPNLGFHMPILINRALAWRHEINAGHRCYTPLELRMFTPGEYENADDQILAGIGQMQRERCYKQIQHPPPQKQCEDARKRALLKLWKEM